MLFAFSYKFSFELSAEIRKNHFIETNLNNLTSQVIPFLNIATEFILNKYLTLKNVPLKITMLNHLEVG